MFRIVLVQPEIPPNTGNVIRLAANTGCELHLIEPLGFSMEDRLLQRAGLDYHEYAPVRRHAGWNRFVEAVQPDPARLFAFTTRGSRPHGEVAWQAGDTLVFGSESAGLPSALREGGALLDMQVPAVEYAIKPYFPMGEFVELHGPHGQFMSTIALYAYAGGFEHVTGIAYGTRDAASLYDSSGDDTLTARPTAATLAGAGFENTAQGFRRVNAYAAAGGTDTSYLYDSIGADTLAGRTAYALLSGKNYANYAYGFEANRAFSTAGADRATLVDSAGDDVFTGGASTSSLRAAGVSWWATS